MLNECEFALYNEAKDKADKYEDLKAKNDKMRVALLHLLARKNEIPGVNLWAEWDYVDEVLK